MHVFLTGASGWIGTVIARELIAAGHSVCQSALKKDPPSASKRDPPFDVV